MYRRPAAARTGPGPARAHAGAACRRTSTRRPSAATPAYAPAAVIAPADRMRRRVAAPQRDRLHLRLRDRARLDAAHVRDLRDLRRVPTRAPVARSQPAPHRAARRGHHVRVGAARTSAGSPTSCGRTSNAIAQNMATLRDQTTQFRDPMIWMVLAIVARGIVEIVAFILLDGDLITHDHAEGAIEDRTVDDLHAARRAGCAARSGAVEGPAQLRRAGRGHAAHVRHLLVLVGVRRDDRGQPSLPGELALGRRPRAVGAAAERRVDGATTTDTAARATSRVLDRAERTAGRRLGSLLVPRPDRPQPKDVETRIEILHPGDDDGNGLVRHCSLPGAEVVAVGRRRPVVGVADRGEAVRVVALRRDRQTAVVARDRVDPPHRSRRRPHAGHVRRGVRSVQSR